MPDEIAHARGWFLKADSDFTAAKHILESQGPYDTACFHASRHPRNTLRACRHLPGRFFPLTHNLEELQRLGEAAVPGWPLAGLDLTELTPFAVQLRYDFEFWPDHKTAEQAVRLAAEVRQRVLDYLPEDARP